MTLQGLINQAYPSPEWAVFFEVSNATGFGASRRADAVALGIWPSRGHTLIGFEFKVDRRDWLREKKNPAKADTIAAHCDGWYVVAGSDSVVKIDEMPEPWGLKVANEDGTRLKTVKECVWFPDRDKSTMRRSFAAAMLRKVTETTVPKVELERIVEERVKVAVDHSREGRDIKRLTDVIERQQKILDTFHRITGIDLTNGWQGPAKIAEAVRAVMDGDSHRQSLVHAKRILESSARQMEQALASWPTVVPAQTDATTEAAE